MPSSPAPQRRFGTHRITESSPHDAAPESAFRAPPPATERANRITRSGRVRSLRPAVGTRRSNRQRGWERRTRRTPASTSLTVGRPERSPLSAAPAFCRHRRRLPCSLNRRSVALAAGSSDGASVEVARASSGQGHSTAGVRRDTAPVVGGRHTWCRNVGDRGVLRHSATGHGRNG
jgi:hypothetical protein